jgi:hypothetical protein
MTEYLGSFMEGMKARIADVSPSFEPNTSGIQI